MIIQNISFTGKTKIADSQKQDKTEVNKTDYKPSDGKTKLKKTLISLGAIAAAGIGISYVVRKGKINALKNVAKGIVAGAAGAGVGINVYKYSTDKDNRVAVQTRGISVGMPNNEKPQEVVSQINQDVYDDTRNIYQSEMPELNEEKVSALFDKEMPYSSYEMEYITNDDTQQDKNIEDYCVPEEHAETVEDDNTISQDEDQQDNNEPDAPSEDVVRSQIIEMLKKMPQDVPDEMFLAQPVEITNEEKQYNLKQPLESLDETQDVASQEQYTSPDFSRMQRRIEKRFLPEEFNDQYKEKIAEATEEYNQRVAKNLKLSQRIKIIENETGKNDSVPLAVKMRKLQLELLPQDKINALDDRTISHMLHRPTFGDGLLSNMGYLKSLSSEQLVEIQTNKEKRYALYQLLEGNPKGFMFDCLLHKIGYEEPID